jgi:hypothetical protein
MQMKNLVPRNIFLNTDKRCFQVLPINWRQLLIQNPIQEINEICFSVLEKQN